MINERESRERIAAARREREMSKLPSEPLAALVRMAQNGMHSGIAASLEQQVKERAAALVRPTTPEPMCCDVHAAGWQALTDRADEIEGK